MTLKEKIYQAYYQLITEKITAFNQAMNDLNESSRNETKSSAGDKYETTRAMLQLEKEKVIAQLKEAQQQKALLEQIEQTPSSNKIAKGSLVKTNKGYFLVSIAIGKVIVDGETVISVSPQSPLGNKLIGLQMNESAAINGIAYLIESIE